MRSLAPAQYRLAGRRRLALLGVLAITSLLLAGCGSEVIKHRRSVTATAYTLVDDGSEGGVGAWGDDLEDFDHSIAVSRDLLRRGLTHGTEVTIDGVDGTWVVRDKMARRWNDRIDLLMDDVDEALDWGKRKVTIHWVTPEPD